MAGLRVAVAALEQGATSKTAKAELGKLIRMKELDAGKVDSLAAMFQKWQAASEVTKAEFESIKQVADRAMGREMLK